MAEKKLGALVDALYNLREARSRKLGEADAIRTEAAMLEKELLDRFDKADLSGAVGKTAKLGIKTVVEPTVVDFVAIFKYAARTKNYGLLQRRLNGRAVRDLWNEGKNPAGVGTFDRVKISVTKIT